MLGPLTGWMSSKPSPSTEVSAPIIRNSTGSPRTTVSCSSGGLYSNTLHGPQPRFSVYERSADSMSATTTAICVIVMGTDGVTMRPPLLLAIGCLLECYAVELVEYCAVELVEQPVEVCRRVGPVEDGAAADDHVRSPARYLRRVADRHTAVDADQDVGPVR